MSYEKGVGISGFPFALIEKATGDAITTGTVSAFVKKDGGAQAAATNTAMAAGNGEWCIDITAGEMDADIVGLLFTHSLAIPAHFTIATVVEPSGSFITGVSSLVNGVSIYGSVAGANTYFAQRLHTGPWDTALASDRTKALIMATRAIDKLNYAGVKAVEAQSLQFPRETDIVVPLNVEIAAYECVLQYLDGFNIDEETRSLGILKNRGWGAELTYDSDYHNEYIRNGIPSIEAWYLLLPFLRDQNLVNLSRV
jgi:hypothetical protein